MIEIKDEINYAFNKYTLNESDRVILKKGTIILDSGPIYSGVSGTDGESETWESGYFLAVLTPISPRAHKAEETKP